MFALTAMACRKVTWSLAKYEYLYVMNQVALNSLALEMGAVLETTACATPDIFCEIVCVSRAFQAHTKAKLETQTALAVRQANMPLTKELQRAQIVRQASIPGQLGLTRA